ncbi:hypothetical protein POV27_15090 [Aureisphaera galaxeae]|uniref:hypothetical protein n=1 Tax=Aureisphaera galaxeae TaxID=1538023 RepID=UPI0023510332|nr:hypothetical protein [Aureisphaera galaxeae]MDC8005387.1 hypothetical protein [Aureisphaera galaxeae]
MITIAKNPAKAQEYADLILTSKGNYISPLDKLNNWNGNLSNEEQEVLDYLIQNLRKLLVAEPEEQQEIIDSFKEDTGGTSFQDRIYDSVSGNLTPFGEGIKKKFNYEGFRSSAKAIWLAKQIPVKSCPYCNAQYTLSVKQKNAKTKLLFHLDHYYPKSVYPYLSLSFYNLIPSCASCNMSKSDEPFSLSDFLHPYVNSVDDIARYETDKGNLVKFLTDMNNFEEYINLTLELREQFLGDAKWREKLEKYKKMFKVESQYNEFKDVVAETYLKGIFYSKSRKDELVDFFKDHQNITLTEEMINRFIIGNYTDKEDLLKRPLAKMMRDISEDFGLL